MIDVTTKIVNLDGTPIVVSGKDLDLKTVCVSALYAADPNKKVVDGMEEYLKAELAERIYKAEGGKVALTAEEVALLKKQIPLQWKAGALKQAYDLLDANAKLTLKKGKK